MLIFSRKRNECLVIGDQIRVTVLDISGDIVKVGIEAPRLIPIHREEVYLKIQRANLAAADFDDAPTALQRVRRLKSLRPPADAPGVLHAPPPPGGGDGGVASEARVDDPALRDPRVL